MNLRIEKVREKFKQRLHSLGTARAVVLAILLIAAIVYGTFYLVNAANANGSLASTGTIEATEIRIAPEIGGTVAEVLVSEGDQVTAGQPLMRLDDALLQIQRDQALAGLAKADLELVSAQQAYDDLFEGLDLATAMALQEVAAARAAVDEAQRDVINLGAPGEDFDINTARANVVLARDVLEKAEDDFEDYANKPEDNLVRAMLQLKLARAQEAYDAAVRQLNYLEGTANSIDMGVAEADLEVAQARLAQAETDYAAMANGPDPDLLTLAQGRLDLAQAGLAAAEATLESADLQIAKAELTAPVAATVLYRNIQPGEFAAPGATVIVLAQLDDLTITVYLSEDRYGQVNLGDKADVQVDSFPGVVFTGTVIHIADEAEFTPRNVQTGEGRRTTVFAIKLQLEDPDGRLKPGMPADVTFTN